jgi:hypothetical protein
MVGMEHIYFSHGNRHQDCRDTLIYTKLDNKLIKILVSYLIRACLVCGD